MGVPHFPSVFPPALPLSPSHSPLMSHVASRPRAIARRSADWRTSQGLPPSQTRREETTAREEFSRLMHMCPPAEPILMRVPPNSADYCLRLTFLPAGMTVDALRSILLQFGPIYRLRFFVDARIAFVRFFSRISVWKLLRQLELRGVDFYFLLPDERFFVVSPYPDVTWKEGPPPGAPLSISEASSLVDSTLGSENWSTSIEHFSYQYSPEDQIFSAFFDVLFVLRPRGTSLQQTVHAPQTHQPKVLHFLGKSTTRREGLHFDASTLSRFRSSDLHEEDVGHGASGDGPGAGGPATHSRPDNQQLGASPFAGSSVMPSQHAKDEHPPTQPGGASQLVPAHDLARFYALPDKSPLYHIRDIYREGMTGALFDGFRRFALVVRLSDGDVWPILVNLPRQEAVKSEGERGSQPGGPLHGN
ncbi:hypothetical protein H696_01115 [Fonticula alba]|uniref:Uncharacterized protein n=1 Tax=Fonticula alba TaxID=691883 RepID=A0A058ZCM5_FONAL|nr:hypothetical protein H696_01115 [Fonticula alba]KCV71691.1 hypothetical protein H696_01115 [Fonticula alba]|eukprot:XP_009493269.1 hypothetical protein H696_01115 [Fonticula alba]